MSPPLWPGGSIFPVSRLAVRSAPTNPDAVLRMNVLSNVVREGSVITPRQTVYRINGW